MKRKANSPAKSSIKRQRMTHSKAGFFSATGDLSDSEEGTLSSLFQTRDNVLLHAPKTRTQTELVRFNHKSTYYLLLKQKYGEPLQKIQKNLKM